MYSSWRPHLEPICNSSLHVKNKFRAASGPTPFSPFVIVCTQTHDSTQQACECSNDSPRRGRVRYGGANTQSVGGRVVSVWGSVRSHLTLGPWPDKLRWVFLLTADYTHTTYPTYSRDTLDRCVYMFACLEVPRQQETSFTSLLYKEASCRQKTSNEQRTHNTCMTHSCTRHTKASCELISQRRKRWRAPESPQLTPGWQQRFRHIDQNVHSLLVTFIHLTPEARVKGSWDFSVWNQSMSSWDLGAVFVFSRAQWC